MMSIHCLVMAGVLYVTTGEDAVAVDQVIKEESEQYVQLISPTGDIHEFYLPRYQWSWNSAEWYSHCLSNARSWDGSDPLNEIETGER